MISAALFAYRYNDVPTPWIFEYYCKLEERLSGQTVVIHSIFKEENTPSMKIFFSEGKYFFKDFSTGYGGNGAKMVTLLFKEDYKKAYRRIISDYNRYILGGGHVTPGAGLVKKEGYKVTDFRGRKWNVLDKDFWTAFNISSRILERYCVRPLEEFTMHKPETEPIVFREERMYGYFTKGGELYKIYRPGQKLKFITVKSYIQGLDQIKNHRYLLLCSSLKDIMSVSSLGLKLDLVAGESENTYIPEPYIKHWKDCYTKIACLLDRDDAGIKAMRVYREKYGISPVLLNLSKDVSDSIRDFGPMKVRNTLVPMLDKVVEIVEL